MTLHLSVMALAAAGLALGFAVLQRDDRRSQVRFALKVFGALVAGAIALGLVQFLAFR